MEAAGSNPSDHHVNVATRLGIDLFHTRYPLFHEHSKINPNQNWLNTEMRIYTITRLVLLITLMTLPSLVTGCSKEKVPNATAEEIESAKHDPLKAKQQKNTGAAMPPH